MDTGALVPPNGNSFRCESGSHGSSYTPAAGSRSLYSVLLDLVCAGHREIPGDAPLAELSGAADVAASDPANGLCSGCSLAPKEVVVFAERRRGAPSFVIGLL